MDQQIKQGYRMHYALSNLNRLIVSQSRLEFSTPS